MARSDNALRAQDAAGARRQGSPHPLDHGRPGLRRRFGLHHRRHAAEHRRRGPGRHSRAAQGPPAQSRAGLREWRRLPAVLVRRRTRGGSGPFVLVVEGSIPNEKIKKEGYWAALGHRQDRPASRSPTCEWIDRLAPKAWAVVAAGTCATYGGIHAMAGQSHRLHGPGRLPGLGLEIARPACRSSTCPAAPCSPTTSWRRCSICCTRRRAWRR